MRVPAGGGAGAGGGGGGGRRQEGGIYVAEELYRWTPAGGAASQYERQNCNTLNRRNCKSVTLNESLWNINTRFRFESLHMMYDVTALGWTIKGITDHAIPLPRLPLLNKLNTFSDTFFLTSPSVHSVQQKSPQATPIDAFQVHIIACCQNRTLVLNAA
jgi:hypothetical protein